LPRRFTTSTINRSNNPQGGPAIPFAAARHLARISRDP
jgi:hypothetical protein